MADSVHSINQFLDSLESEARARRADDYAQWNRDLRFFRGAQWSDSGEQWQSRLVMNWVDILLRRNVGLLADSRPIIKVFPRKSGPQAREVAQMLELIIRALWDEYSVTQQLERMMMLSATMSHAGMSMTYNPVLDHGRGDIDIQVLDPRSMLFDHMVEAPEMLTRGEYIMTEAIRPLTEAYELYGSRIEHLEADADISQFEGRRDGPIRRMVSHLVRTPVNRGANVVDSAIPRVWVQEFWLQDRTRNDSEDAEIMLGTTVLGTPITVPPGARIYPGGRRVVRVGRSSKQIVIDERNPYWDQTPPVEIFNWRVDPATIYSASEVHFLKTLQEHINHLSGLASENISLMQNGIWIADVDALDDDEWDNLTNEPGNIVRKNPGRELRRETGVSIPRGVLQFIQMLVQTMNDMAGISDVTSGKPEAGVTSGVAIESLQIASNTIVRQRARQLENFMTRFFYRFVPRIFQFFTSDRLLHLTGPNAEFQAFEFSRQELNRLLEGMDIAKAYRDFSFAVVPGSALGLTRVQRSIMATQLFQLGIIDDEAVLESVEFPQAEEVLQRTRQKQALAQQGQITDPTAQTSRAMTPAGGSRTPAAAPAGVIGGAAGAAAEGR